MITEETGPGMVVHKYEVPFGQGLMPLPVGARILHVDVQPNSPTGEGVFAWALVDPSADREKRQIGYFATGELIPEGAKHIGTALSSGGAFVWHVFELKVAA